MSDRVRISLDADALRHNLAVVRRRAPRSKVIAVVKANAYGHGIAFASRTLAGVVDGFAVASVPEAIELRHLGATGPLWVLSDFYPQTDLEAVIDYDLCPVIHTASQLAALVGNSRPVRQVAVKIDTGMGRLGFDPEEIHAVVDALADRSVEAIMLMSHLANADIVSDPRNQKQLDVFEDATTSLQLERSVANSAAIMGFENAQYDWVRPGLMLYGASPLAGKRGPDLGLKAVMTVSARILATRRFRPGQPVGYGGIWTCERDTRAAILSCGYGDGYPRNASSGTPVLFAEGLAPVIGRVSMDSMAVDITDLGDVDLTQRVVLFGPGLPVDDVARYCDTITYELMCRMGSRKPVIEMSHGDS